MIKYNNESLLALRQYDNFNYCVLEQRSKKPLHKNWNTITQTLDDVILEHQNKELNIGLVLGKTSGAMDIDCDSQEAVAVADYLNDSNHAHFKRNQSSSHFFYLCKEGGKTIQLKDPDTNASLVELRGDGGQTMIPPSIHPNGEQLEWNTLPDNLSHHSYDELIKQVYKIGAISLLLKSWERGSRHQLSLAFAGLCQSLKIDYDDAFILLDLVCKIKQDEETNARLDNLKFTYQKPEMKNIGFTGVQNIIGSQRAQKLSAWLQKAFDVESYDLATLSNTSVMEVNSLSRPEDVNETNMAKGLSSYLKHKALFCFDDKHWYLWNGKHWEKDKKRKIVNITTDFLLTHILILTENRRFDIAQRMMSFQSRQKIENIMELAKPKLAVSLTDFDTKPMQLCIDNGVIDLNSGELLEAKSDMMHSKFAPIDYNPEADCPSFKRFMNDVFNNDEVINYIQKVVGYTLTGNIHEQCLFMLIGSGANGKSTLVNILSDMMGTYATNTAARTFMASANDNIGDDLVRLSGARMITASETEHGQRFAEAKIKSFTGGDTITARPLYGEYINFKPIGKIWLTTNNRPEIRGSDDGIWRRIKEIPFNRQFTSEEQDKELEYKLVLEMPGILNWAIEGCLKMQSEGLTTLPASIEKSVREYRQEMDTVSSFIDEICVQSPDTTTVSTMYESYRDWCQTQRCHAVGKGQFGKAMQEHGYVQERDRNGRYWKGVSIFRLAA